METKKKIPLLSHKKQKAAGKGAEDLIGKAALRERERMRVREKAKHFGQCPRHCRARGAHGSGAAGSYSEPSVQARQEVRGACGWAAPCGNGDADEKWSQQLDATATGAAAETVQLPHTYFQAGRSQQTMKHVHI